MRPTPGSSTRKAIASSRSASASQSRVGSSGLAGAGSSRSTCWIRGAFDRRQAAGPDRLLDLLDRRVADLDPGRQRRAQALVGDVAIAVVGVLGEDRPHQLGDRMAVRMVDRPAVELAQPVADREHARTAAAASTRLPSSSRRSALTGARIFSAGDGDDRPGGWSTSTACAPSTAGSTARARRRSSSTAIRPTPRTGSPSSSGSRARRVALDLPGLGPHRAPRPDASTTRCTGLARFFDRFLDGLEIDELLARRPRLGRRRADRAPSAARRGCGAWS